MGSATPSKTPNVYQIGGIPVDFPYKPYGSQLAFMGRVISTLDRARRQGHCHALLESPTGTGKSLSLLCSALAWQQNQKSKNQVLDISRTRPSPGIDPAPDPHVYGGGFIPESQPSSNLTSGDLEQSGSATNNRIQRKLTTSTIYYASRTHSQISQVIREYRKTSYRVPMAVLASRKHYCTNKHVCMKENVDEECKLLLKGTEVGCFEFKNVHKVKGHPSLQKGGCHEAHDIEDLVKVGQAVRGCSYFAARSMAVEAQLVFCPYSYIINPIIRRAMEVDLKGAIVILDEAHNIEDMARDAGSLDVEEEVLDTLQMELGQLCLVDSVAMIYQPLYDMIQGIISWIGQRKNNLQKREFEHYFSCWTGDKALRELQEAGISQECFPILQECATKAIKAASDAELEGVYLSGKSAATLEGLFSSFTYFFSENGLHVFDYQLALQRYVKRDAGHAASGWTHSLSLWCLNPAVVFREIANLSISVILTSGTLSPMGSFASELGVQFESCMEAPHVIDVESQLWAAVISTGPGNCQLNASYRTADAYAFQDALGASLEEICKIVPNGALVFFPSYKLLEKLRSRWVQTGQWSRLNAQKSLFVETRGNQDDFEAVLKGYYDAIRGNNRPAPWKVKKDHKRDSKKINAVEVPPNSGTRGAAFLAVCRGKVSEGIDFSDENARVVVIVGIPFPNKSDMQVVVKKNYNDTYKSSKNLLSGSQWYCHQAFRALNQAAGRCIRHRFDYGAIILLDARFKEAQNMSYISKWLRKSVTQYDSFDESLQGLHSFFRDVKERVSPNVIKACNMEVEILDIDEEVTPSKRNTLGNGAPRKKKPKMNMVDQNSEGKVVSDSTMPTVQKGQLTQFFAYDRKTGASLSKLEAPGNIERAASICTDEKDFSSCREYIDLECNFEKETRWSEAASTASSNSSPDPCIVAETPVAGNTLASSWISSKDECSHSSAVEASDKSMDQMPFHSISTTNDNGVLIEGAYTLAVTPERRLAADICNPEAESSLNLSVNSHSQKRRKSLGVPLSIHARMSQFGSPSSELSLHFDHSRSDNQRIESDFEKPKVPTKNTCAALPTSSEYAKKRLHICCLHCGSSLGLPENCFRVMCSLTSSSKVYLISVMKSGCFSTQAPDSLSENERTSVPVVISDKLDVDQRLYDSDTIKGSQNGIWCEEDGCVFRTVCCPFCTSTGTCLGLQIMATDASNVHLLNKICFFADRLNFKNHETSEEEVLLPPCSSDHCQVSCLTSIEKFSYFAQQKNFTCSSTTKSKLRLPKKDLVPSLDNQGGDDTRAKVDIRDTT